MLREINEAAKEGFKFIPRTIIAIYEIAVEWWGLILLCGIVLGFIMYLVGK